MAGKIILGILGVLLLLLAVILLTPAGVRFRYDRGDLSLLVRFGPLKLQIFPRKEKKPPRRKPEETKEEPEKKQTGKKSADNPEKKQTEKRAPEKPKPKKKAEKKPRAKINREQILYSLETLPPILGRALKRTGRRLRLTPLKVHLLVAGPDPADTALLYGRLEAALGAALPALHRLVRIKDQDVRLFLDFQREQMDLIADVGLSLRPWDLVSVGLRAGGSLLKWYLRFRKLASPPPAEEPKESNTEAA